MSGTQYSEKFRAGAGENGRAAVMARWRSRRRPASASRRCRAGSVRRLRSARRWRSAATTKSRGLRQIRRNGAPRRSSPWSAGRPASIPEARSFGEWAAPQGRSRGAARRVARPSYGGTDRFCEAQQRQRSGDARQIRQLERELARKEKARRGGGDHRAPKKVPGYLGGRGRRHGREERQMIRTLVDEAVAAGARQAEACKGLMLPARTLQRWAHTVRTMVDTAPKHTPSNKLSGGRATPGRRRRDEHRVSRLVAQADCSDAG